MPGWIIFLGFFRFVFFCCFLRVVFLQIVLGLFFFNCLFVNNWSLYTSVCGLYNINTYTYNIDINSIDYHQTSSSWASWLTVFDFNNEFNRNITWSNFWSSRRTWKKYWKQSLKLLVNLEIFFYLQDMKMKLSWINYFDKIH